VDSIRKDDPALLQHANLRDYGAVCGDFTWAAALHKRTGIDIPEADHGKLITIGGAVAYLSSKSGG
jgi:hypothetical protein